LFSKVAAIEGKVITVVMTCDVYRNISHGAHAHALFMAFRRIGGLTFTVPFGKLPMKVLEALESSFKN
jgi:hypothetical protein